MVSGPLPGVRVVRVGSLCQGIGGADLALEAHGHTIAWGAEIDPAPAAVCSRHWPDAPNHGDITAIDWAGVEPVDIVSAGYPCQPFSTAGRRQGASDARHLWPAVRDAVGALRPRYVFLENVRGHLTLGGAVVISDLAALGYVGAWGVLGSAAFGCHRRDRLWFVAADASRVEVGSEPLAIRRGGDPVVAGQHREAAAVDLLLTPTAADGDRASRTYGRGNPTLVGALDDTFGRYAPAVSRWAALFGPPPPPTSFHNVRRRKGRTAPLNPAFVEWMMGFPPGWVTDPSLELTRAQQLKALGNAQQPQTAAAAIAVLGRRVDAEIAREAA